MSLSAISSNLSAVNEAVAQTTPTPKAPAQPAPASPASDTVTVSPEAQKLQIGDADSDGDSR